MNSFTGINLLPQNQDAELCFLGSLTEGPIYLDE